MEEVLNIIPNLLDYSVALVFALVLIFGIWIIFKQTNKERYELMQKINDLHQEYAKKSDELNKEFKEYLKNSVYENRETQKKIIDAFEMLTEAFNRNTTAIEIFNTTMLKHQTYWDLKKNKDDSK